MQTRKLTLLPAILTLFLTACLTDDAKECESLYYDKPKQLLAKPYCEKSATQGNAISQFLYSQLLFAEENAESEQQAVSWLEKSANQRYAPALFQLGERYEIGKALAQDQDKSQFYYDLSCQNGEVKGCERVAIFKKKIAETEQKQKEEERKLREAEKLAEERKAFVEQQEKFAALQREKEQQLAKEKALLEQQLALVKREEEQRQKEQALAEQQRLVQQNASSAANYGYQVSSAAQYRDTTDLKFFDGLAVFKENGLYGFVNSSGLVVIPAQFAYAGRFSRERSAVKSTETQSWGFIDKQGKYVVEPIYCVLAAFSESDGLAGVYKNGYKVGDKCEGGKWGFMDTSGNWVVDPILDYAERFVNGKAKVTYKGKTGYINRYSQWVDE